MLNRPSLPNVINASDDEQGFDLREGIGFVWRQWMFISSIVGAVLVAAIVYEYTRTPLYTANAQVLLEPSRERPLKEDAVAYYPGMDYNIIESQIAIIKSTVFLRRVADKLQRASDPEFNQMSPDTAVTTLKGAISVARAGQGGYVLSISATSVDPARAATLANAVADAYVVEKLDARFEAAKRASAWLSDRLVELRKQLRASEEAVAQFRADHGLVQSGNAVSLNQQQLSEINAKFVDARADLAQKKARVDVLRSILEKGGNVQSLPDLPSSPQLQTLRVQEANLSQKVADLEARYNDRHPLVINARAEYRDVQRAIANELQRSVASVNNDYELAKARVGAVEQSLREATGQSGLDEKTAITLRELDRTAAVNKNMFEEFLQRAKITDEQSTFEARDARVITPAFPPSVPSYPRKTQFLTLALIFGLFLGIGGAVAKDKLNGGFATPRQIEDMLDLPLLASVNTMTKEDLTIKGKTFDIPHYLAAMPLSRFSESIRTLRSGIMMTDVDEPPKIVLISSTLPNEGKTTIAVSLAISAAAAGLKVLLIDGDLRHSSVTRAFDLQKHAGIVDMLVGNTIPNDAITYSEVLKIWVLPAGSATRNPGDLIGSERMKSFIAASRQTFDFIVVDAPPIGPVIDALIFAQLADKVVYVVRWASTARELVQQTIQRLPREKLAGSIFNRVNERAAQKYGKYAYQYYYAHEYRKYYKG